MELDAGELFTQYAPRIRHFLAARVDPDDIEDLVQATFERVVRYLPRYEDRGWPITAWLYRIAHARAIDLYRRRGHRTLIPLEAWTAWIDGPEDVIARRDYHAWIRTKICECLHGEQQEVIWLRFVEDLSILETARRIDITTDAVKAAQFRGIAQLRMAIAPDEAPSMMAAMAAALELKPRCIVAECCRPQHARGYCNRHYRQQKAKRNA